MRGSFDLILMFISSIFDILMGYRFKKWFSKRFYRICEKSQACLWLSNDFFTKFIKISLEFRRNSHYLLIIIKIYNIYQFNLNNINYIIFKLATLINKNLL